MAAEKDSSGLSGATLLGVLWSALEVWGGRVIKFAIFLLLARLLQPKAFGLVAMAGVYLAFLNVFVNQGFAAAIVQRDELEDGHLDTAFWANLGAGAFLAAGSVLAADPVARLYGEAELAPVVRWLSLSLIITGLVGVQSALFSRKLDFKLLSIRTLSGQIAGGIVGITMAFMGYGVWSLVAQQLTSNAVGGVLLWQMSDWRPGLSVSRRHFKDLFSFSVNLLGANFLNFFNRRADDFLIGVFLGSTALGYYTVAYSLIRTLNRILSRVISRVAFPVFSKMQGNPERLRRAFYKVTRYTSFVAFPVFLGLAALAPEIVEVVFGEKWLPSVPVMRVLAFIGILESVSHFNDVVVLAMGKSSWSLGLTFVNAVLNVIGFAIAVRWGITAVAAAYVIRGYLVSPLQIWMVHRLIHIDVLRYLRQFAAALAGSVLMAATVVAAVRVLSGHASPGLLLIAYVLLGAAAYITAISLMAPSLPRQILALAQSATAK